MLPLGISVLIPVISKHSKDTQFHNLGQSTCIREEPTLQVCSWLTNEVLSESMTCRHSDTRSTSHFLRPWVTPGGLKVATFCMRNSVHTHSKQASTSGIWARVTSAVRLLTRLHHVPQTQKLLGKAEMTK